MAPQYVRQTAVPVTLGELAGGTWMPGAGVEPSGVRCARGFISRANVIGVIVGKDEGGFSLDDGTGAMSVRSFDAHPSMLAVPVGTVVLVIGRPRDYNGERYLVLEICKGLRSTAWAQYRRKELALFAGIAPAQSLSPIASPGGEVVVEVPASAGKNPYEIVIDIIRELDTGRGSDVDAVLARYGGDDGEEVLRSLMEEGEIFELRPGTVKVLE